MTLIEDARKRFEGAVTEHQMTVFRDDGFYRHLRFQKPGTSIYYFDLITWPGYLAITGDCGHYLFSRTRDMFEFFENDHGEINPQYWAEKLQAPDPDGAMRYSYERYAKLVEEWIEHNKDYLGEYGLQNARAELLSEEFTYEDEARFALRNFRVEDLWVEDAWEWDLRDYDFRFLWCCYAIVWGIAEYRKIEENRL